VKAASEEASTVLTPIPRDRINPRLLAHLEPGEQVLWQGQPRQGSFFGPGVAATGVGLVMAGILLAFGLGGHVLASDLRRLWAILGVLAGLIVLARGWSRRAGLWSYAVTDRRLLSVLGRRLIRSVTPSQLDRMGLKIHGNTVYWAKTKRNTSTTFNDTRMSGPDGRFIGFHGQDDPEAIKTMIEAWRLAMSDRAAGEAKSFVRAMPTTARPEEEIAPEAQSLPKGVRRIVHPPTGLSIDVPSTWEVLVSNHTEGPLKLFGLTLLPSFIRETKAIPYTQGAEWNRLQVRAAPEAGISLSLSEEPLAVTPDIVRNDPLIGLTGTRILRFDDNLDIGPFTGFGTIRALPAGTRIRSNEALSAPVIHRQIWLQGAGLSIEIQGSALEDQADIQYAIEAMIASLCVSDQSRPPDHSPDEPVLSPAER
jgi:hypothetical protein